MPNLSQVKRQINTLSKMKSVVSSLKTMSAAAGAKFVKAALSADEFAANLELAMRAVFKAEPRIVAAAPDSVIKKVVLIGSDIGLVGKLNKGVVHHFEAMGSRVAGAEVIICGRALRARYHQQFKQFMEMPKSVGRLAAVAEEIMLALEVAKLAESGGSIVIVHNVRSGGRIHVMEKKIFPIDDVKLNSIRSVPWADKAIPDVGANASETMAKIMAQYAYSRLFRALCLSLEAEHISRAQAMSRAGDNIDARLHDKKIEYALRSQEETTLELIDSFSGFKIVSRQDVSIVY
ncbi:MAG: F0F1 ATP synthase subunit gamma [Alphaproteobacteria bacterium]|nr:F0F1 ATP synthase subunit gamma [Alphaproteobacteria bacterium]